VNHRAAVCNADRLRFSSHGFGRWSAVKVEGCMSDNSVVNNGVTRQVLDNGLSVVVREMHHAPVASLWLWHRVGSRNEIPGITGISHWVEHMMFKGTARVPKGELDRLISREGGYNNALTWIDWTTYFVTLPVQRISLALEIEADRMVNALFDAQEVEAERTVIISERQGSENEPGFRLGEAVQAAAFRVHPYHHMVIGDMCDLTTITRDDLYHHYHRYYPPNNAVLVMAGDIDAGVALQQIEANFGDIRHGEAVPSVTREEPVQAGERRVIVEGEGTTAYVELAFRAPRATDPDFFPMLAMNAILAGIGQLSPFGGGSANRSSRLYRALVEAELASSVAGDLAITVDPFLYTLSATVRAGRTPEQIEEAMWAQVERIVKESPSEEELFKALKQAKAHFAYGSESVTNQALWIGFSEMVDDYGWFISFIDQLSQVTVNDVCRVAEKYLSRRSCTVGWYVPLDDGRWKNDEEN
jgi:zinc protease